ncbi:MAG: hypothetical protein PVH77_11860 [Phycisphaerales bacterium]
MKFYNKIPIWENKERLKLLYAFRELVDTYFNNVEYVRLSPSAEPIENEIAKQKRIEMNRILSAVRNILHSAGLSPIIKYTPPRMIGGYIEHIDITLNMFNLRYYKIPHTKLFDCIDICIGIYSKDSKRAWIRTFNPFYWISCVFDYISRLPFIFLGQMGFDSGKAESSIIGRLVKGILYLIVVFSSLLTILYYLGYLEQFKELIQKKPPAP